MAAQASYRPLFMNNYLLKFQARGCYDKTLLALPMAQFNNVMTSRIKNRLQRKVCCTPIILRKFNIHEGYCLKPSTS